MQEGAGDYLRPTRPMASPSSVYKPPLGVQKVMRRGGRGRTLEESVCKVDSFLVVQNIQQ